MASITKRKGKSGITYRVSIVRKGHPRVTGSFTSKRDAEVWAAETEAPMIGAAAQQSVRSKRTVCELLDAYEAMVLPTHRSAHKTRYLIGHYKRDLPFRNKLVADVTSDDVMRYKVWLASRISPLTKRPLAVGTIRHDYCKLAAIFSRATKADWKWISVSPFHGVPYPSAGKPRTRRWPKADLDRMLAALDGYRRGMTPTTNRHFVACALLLSLETAMRRGEVLSLTRKMITLERSTLTLPETKNGEAREIPLTPAAIDVLKCVMRAAELGPLFPITVGVWDAIFQKSREKAGLSGLNYHDTRREATTTLAAEFSNPLTLAKITGHKTLKILLDHYYRPDMSEIAAQMAKRRRKAA